ncbi:hypothetical protein F5884DRAFT_409657 [Xylogone sp. PMI_703]|nr:hypothetical protein F5884DRAFT_409657 [Xylogone sp. PMI_703]
MPLCGDSSSEEEDKLVSLVIRICPRCEACDICRKRKICCEAIVNVCSQCIKYKTKCHFKPVNVKTGAEMMTPASGLISGVCVSWSSRRS